MECSATVYVIDAASELPLEQGIRFDLPQWTRRGLDPSFFENLHLILAGGNLEQALDDFRNGRAREKSLERIAAAVLISCEHSVHVYACANELCDLLAALDEQRATDIARQHLYLLSPSAQHEEKDPYSPHRFRVPTLMQLTTLAQEAKRSARKLRVRVEYRRRSRGTAGRLSGSEPPRH
ncbi:MAG: hypothetical protein ACREVO_11395 [Steroidobacteraceae bacterium]